MSDSYLSTNNLESISSSALQSQPPVIAKQRAAVLTPLRPTERVITDVAKLPNFNPSLTNRVAAVMLGMSPDTLKHMRGRKQGPAYFKTETGRVRYRLSDVLHYMESRTVRH